MLIRSETYQNDFPERSGKLILAQRLSNTYRIKFIYYGENVTIRMGKISENFYRHIVKYYGRCISHSRNFSEYIITPDRKNFTIWVARHKEITNIVSIAPNDLETKLDTSINNIYQYRLEDTEWNPFYVKQDRWIVKEFKIKSRDYETTFN